MSASLASVATRAAAGAARPSFLGLLRAELVKMAHLRITWVMTALFTLFIVGAQLVLAAGPTTPDQLRHDTLNFFYTLMEGDLSLIRVFSGIAVLVLAAHVIGLEYQHGTIRILLGRGVGRLQLLGAKVLALALVALALLAGGLLIELVFGAGLVTALAESQHPWTALGDEYWVDVRFYLLSVLISLGATLLLGVAASVVGRSLAFGLAVGLSWFAVDNLATIPLTLAYQITHNAFWLNVSGFLLGPLLNRLPDYIAPAWHVTAHGAHGPVTVAQPVYGFGMRPLVTVSGAQALLVIGSYAVVFAATAVVFTRWRDVQE